GESAAREVARRACAFARAAAGGRGTTTLAPLEQQRGSYRTPFARDPLEVPLQEKVALCLRAEEAMRHESVAVRSASARALRERKLFLSSEGADIEQEIVECGAGIDAIATGDGLFQMRSHPSPFGGSNAQAGWEH